MKPERFISVVKEQGFEGGDDEAGFRRGGADEVESLVDVGQRLAGPVSTDLAEQSVFDGIPFGSAGRGMQMVS